nr:hypothetical protein [Acidobacteriota bacterium]
RGVDFQVAAADESDLQRVGARPEIIEAARANYRPPAAPKVAANNSRPAPNRPANAPPSNNSARVPSGAPLGKSEIITMLQGDVPASRVEQFVEARGVNFSITPEIAREINAAGGNRSLIGAITEKSTQSAARDDSPFKPAEVASTGPDYDDYIDRIQSSISANDPNSVIRYAQQAIQLSPEQPTAYSLLGTTLLYFKQDIASAELAMRAALERNGAAAFHVYHDHDGAFGQFCEGSFFVTKTGVSFKANNGLDTFETEDLNIKEVKTNGFVGAQYGAFHIKPKQKINGRDNFNFAPATKAKPEAQLIIRLIQNY